MIAQLARMLRLPPTDVEASMHSERAARAVLTRRNLFAAGAAMATGAAFSFATPEPTCVWANNPQLITGEGKLITADDIDWTTAKWETTGVDLDRAILRGVFTANLKPRIPMFEITIGYRA